MKTVYLHGRLAEELGDNFQLDVSGPAEAVRALETNFPGKVFSLFREGRFCIQRNMLDPGMTEPELAMQTGSDEIHITPVVAGAGGGGGGKGIVTAVLGIALVGAALAFAPPLAGGFLGLNMGAPAFLGLTWGQVALFGVSLALSGISSLLSPTPKIGDYSSTERPENRPSFLFDGVVNTTEQGGAVPLVYGRIRTGSVVVSGAIAVERIPV